MAQISRQIGWSQESNLLYQILNQLNKLTSVLFGLKPTYKVYTAILTAYDNDPPSVIELENTIGTINIVGLEEGVTAITSDSLFTENKTVIFYGSIGKRDSYVPGLQLIPEWQSTGSIKVFASSEGVPSNFVIWNTPIEIRVYS
jgi:hypothetical protein